MKKRSKKNYLVLLIILLVVALLTILINNIIRNYNYVKSDKSILENFISKVNINELDVALSESNETILYVSYNHDKMIAKLDRELLKKIRSYNLEDYVYYCNITDRLENNKYIGDFIAVSPNVNGKLMKAPALIYFKSGDVVEVITSSDKLITSDDLTHLVEKYQIGR